ncbi:MAG: hypothetical protein KDA52_08090 [Planctomycetaceae bacterium]|nr:hypothetical protein [Planctomycetaceae bacterium]
MFFRTTDERVLDMQAEIDALTRQLEVANAEIESLTAVIVRDRARVEAETAIAHRRRADAEGRSPNDSIDESIRSFAT